MRSGGSRLTIKDVAQAAGVHHSTVSLVLAGDPRISSETKEKVLAAVGRLQYTPNRLARGLRTGTARSIALVIWGGAYESSFHYDHMRAVFGAAFQMNYQLLLLNIEQTTLRTRSLESLLLDTATDGGILMGIPVDRKGLERVYDSGYPLVHIGERHLAGRELCFVSGDYRVGSRLATEHLLHLGHQRVACLAQDVPGAPEVLQLRRDGYEEAMQAAHSAHTLIMLGEGTNAWDDVFATIHAQKITAVVTTTNSLGCRLLSECARRGLSVPERISIVAFDDSAESCLVSPALTVVRQPMEDIGRTAVQQLLQVITVGPENAKGIRLPMKLIVRESTARPASL